MKRIKEILMLMLVVLVSFGIAGCTAQSENLTDGAERTDGGVLGLFAGPTYEIPPGTALSFELDETISTESNESGDTFMAKLSEPIAVEGQTLIPAGALAKGRIEEARESGRVEGRASIRVVMSEISHDGKTYRISTDPFVAVADATTGEDAAKIGAGAGVGAVVGGILGGGKGAAAGAAIGGGSGTAVVLSTKGDEIELSAGRILRFVLNEPLQL